MGQLDGARWDFETWDEAATNTVRFKVYYQRAPHDPVFTVGVQLAEELLWKDRTYALLMVLNRIVKRLETQFYKGPWGAIRDEFLALYLPDIPNKYVFKKSDHSSGHAVDIPVGPLFPSYRNKAIAEFEGVKGLDESLWSEDGDLA